MKGNKKPNLRLINGDTEEVDHRENLVNLVKTKREAIIRGQMDRANAIQKKIKQATKDLLESAGGKSPGDY